MAWFIFCLVVIGATLGFIGGVLVVGGTAYAEGWYARERRQRILDAERQGAGFRVVR